MPHEYDKDSIMTGHSTLRILYSFPHRVGAPGIGTTALNQVRSLSDLGAHVTLVCTSLDADVPESTKVVETLRIGGKRIPHRAFGSPDRALAYHDWRVSRMIRRSAPGRYEVVHTWPQSALETIRAARSVGCISSREVPNTHTANAYEQAQLEAQITGVGLRKGHSHNPDARRLSLEEREYREADLLLVPSAHVRATFIERKADPARLRLHQYGYDQTRFDAKNRLEWPERPFTALFVGSGEPRKGLHYALAAWKTCNLPPKSRLLIAGGFVPGYRDYVAEQLDIPSVEHLGFVRDVPDLMKRSDVLLLPSVEEGSALVTYEAQASGCIPLVSSAAGALLPPALAGYVHAPRDVETLARQLETLANDDPLRSSLRDAVVDWSIESLSWTSAGHRMIRIFQEAIDAREGARR